MSNFVAISDARANLPDLVNRVHKFMDRVVITVSGKPKATLISQEELESIEETAEILAIPGALESIRKGQEEIKRGDFITLEELLKQTKS